MGFIVAHIATAGHSLPVPVAAGVSWSAGGPKKGLRAFNFRSRVPTCGPPVSVALPVRPMFCVLGDLLDHVIEILTHEERDNGNCSKRRLALARVAHGRVVTCRMF